MNDYQMQYVLDELEYLGVRTKSLGKYDLSNLSYCFEDEDAFDEWLNKLFLQTTPRRLLQEKKFAALSRYIAGSVKRKLTELTKHDVG